MKKLISIVLALALVLAFTACGEKESGGNTPETKTYVFAYEGHDIAVSSDMSEVLKVLGEPISYFEAESCAFDGLDKTYTYSGFEITTRPDGDKDFINAIVLTDDSVATKEGVYISSEEAAIVKAYGESKDYSYDDGKTILSFIVTDGAVSSIQYLEK